MNSCGFRIGDWACRDGGYLYDAGSGEGWSREECTHICPNCRTKDYLLAAKEEAEGVSYWSDNGSAGDGLDIWVAAERRAIESNKEAAEKALSEIGVVEALERDNSEQGYRVTLCNTGGAVESKGAQIMTISNEQIQALQAAAEKAGGEEWVAFIDSPSATCAVHTPGDKRCENVIKWPGFDGQKNAKAKATFIAAANPAAILSLLADRAADKALIAEQAKRISELQSENEYIRKRFKESDLMFGKNILVMQAAIIEWQGTGDAKQGLAWIYNTLFGPGELPDEAEKDAQAYFDRKYAPLDEELMALHQWFWAQSEAERAAAGITLVVGGE